MSYCFSKPCPGWHVDTAKTRLADLEARRKAIAKGKSYKLKRAPIAKRHNDFSRATKDWDEVSKKLKSGDLVTSSIFSNFTKVFSFGYILSEVAKGSKMLR